MTIEVSVTTRGAGKLEERLKMLPAGDDRGAIRAGLQRAAEAVQKHAREDAPIGRASPYRPRPGEYRRRIGIYDLRSTGKVHSIRVRAFAPHSHLLERGTKERRPRRARVMTPNPDPGGPYFGRRAKALPARYIFRRAVRRTNISREFLRGLDEEITAIVEAPTRGE